ncbi:hypothetical protein [Photobacterium sp. DNB22_13_2]
MFCLRSISVVFMLLSSVTVKAVELPDWLAISGFASVAAAKSDNETPYYYTRNITDDWCFDCDTIVGLQADVFPTDWLHASVQVVKRPADDFSDPDLEWAYISVEPITDLKIRAGRLRSPTFMYSQVVFVNQAYPWVRLPAEVYDTTGGFTRYDGIDAYYTWTLSDSLLLQVQPYAAFKTSIDDNEINHVYYDVDLKELYGLRLDLESDVWSIYLNYFESRLDITTVDEIVPVEFNQFNVPIRFEKLSVPIDSQTWSYGLQYEWQDFTTIFEGTISKDGPWGGYISLLYYYNDWTPYVVYGKRSGGEGRSKDGSDSVSLGVRYDILPNLAAVGEWHYTKAKEDRRGSFTPPQVSDITDRSANIFSLGLNYSFSL